MLLVAWVEEKRKCARMGCDDGIRMGEGEEEGEGEIDAKKSAVKGITRKQKPNTAQIDKVLASSYRDQAAVE